MPEIKVNELFACECVKDDIHYFVDAYHTLFPTSNIYVNNRKVLFFKKKWIIS